LTVYLPVSCRLIRPMWPPPPSRMLTSRFVSPPQIEEISLVFTPHNVGFPPKPSLLALAAPPSGWVSRFFSTFFLELFVLFPSPFGFLLAIPFFFCFHGVPFLYFSIPCSPTPLPPPNFRFQVNPSVLKFPLWFFNSVSFFDYHLNNFRFHSAVTRFYPFFHFCHSLDMAFSHSQPCLFSQTIRPAVLRRLPGF